MSVIIAACVADYGVMVSDGLLVKSSDGFKHDIEIVDMDFPKIQKMNNYVCIGTTGDAFIAKVLHDTMPKQSDYFVDDYERGIIDLRARIERSLTPQISANFIIMGIHKNRKMGIKTISSKTEFKVESFIVTNNKEGRPCYLCRFAKIKQNIVRGEC